MQSQGVANGNVHDMSFINKHFPSAFEQESLDYPFLGGSNNPNGDFEGLISPKNGAEFTEVCIAVITNSFTIQ